MPDKKYLIEIPDMPDGSGVWDADKWERNKDAFMADYPDAQVFELGEYDEADSRESDQILLSFEDEASSGIWDQAKWERNKYAFTKDNPEAQVSRVRYVDYWGQKADANRAERASLMQPDEERNAKLAELGYYDDLSEGQRVFDVNAPSMIGLKPLSSAIDTNSVSGHTAYLDPRVQEFFANDSAYTDKMAEIARLDAEYDENPAVIAQREWEAQMLAEQKAYADNLEKEIKGNLESDVDMRKAARGGTAKRGYDSLESQQMSYLLDLIAGEEAGSGEYENEKLERYTTSLKFLEKAKIARDLTGKGFGGAVIDWGKEGLMDAGTQDDVEAYNEIGNILTRLEKEVGNLKEENLTEDVFDKYLSKDEQALIKSFFEYNKAMADAQQDMSRAYKGGKIFSESIPFMLEFLATGGFYKGAGRAATRGLERSLVKWVSKAARNTASRTARKIAAATARDLTYALVGTTARTLASPGTYERMAEASVEIEDGHLNRAKNAAIAAADMYVENLSEISGGLIGKTLGLAGKGVGKLIAKTPLSKVGGMLADNKLMQSISAFMPKLEALGFHGLPEEIGEEFIGNAIREVLNIQPGALKEMVSDDNFGAMLIGFAPMTLIGAAGGAISLGAINYEAAKLGNKMREMMSDHYSAEEMDAMMSIVQNAGTAEEIQQAIKPMALAIANAAERGMLTQEQAAEEIEMLYQWGGFMAQNKALLFSKKAQENELANAKRAEMVDQYGRFWQEDETESVQVATLNNGSTVFVTSAPAEDGKITTIDVQTGKKGFANVSDIATQEVEGEQIQSSNKMTMAAFLNGQIAMSRKTAEETRMTNERNAQIDALRAEITPGTRINLGTEGSPVYVFAKKTSNNGVTIVDETGMESTLGWEQAADALGKPIIVETDQQKLDAEVSARLQRLAERRMQRNISPAVENATAEAAEESAEVVAQEQKHIPLNEDGTVNEAAFWTQDPEGYAEWNDEQNQDGGQDTLRQIAISKAEMFALLSEAQSRQNTSNPAARKAAEKEAAIIAEKIQRLQAMEMKYAEALAEEKEAVKQTAATPTATMSEEQLEQMDTQYQGILGKTRIQSERVRVMQEYLDKLAENSAPIKVLTKDNYEEVMRAEGCPEDDIKRVGIAIKTSAINGAMIAGFASNGVTFVMADTISDVNSARITYIHERQHLLNSQNPEVVKQFAEALGDRENALRILETFVGKNGLEEYKNDPIEKLADEIICRSMEIVYSTENYSVDLQNKGLPEEAINIINTIDNGQRTDKSLASARRFSHASLSKRENTEEDGRNIEQISGGILDGEENGSLGSSSRGDGVGGQGSTGEGAEVISEEQLNAPNSGTAQQITAADGEVLADTNGKGGVRFSIRTWNEGGRDYLAAWLANDAVLTEEEKADILARMDEFYKNALLYSDAYVPFGTWSDAEVRYDNEGNPLMSVVKANGDYAMNLDFSLVCKKRRPLNRLLRTLINRNAFGSYDLKEREIAEINWILQEHGFEVACALCFVDSKRYRVAGVADVFAKLWNNLVTSLAPNGVQIAHFNYNDNPNVEPVENGLDTLPDDQLNWKKLDKAVAKFKKGSVEYKVAQYLREHPEARKLVDATDFIEAEGFEAVKEANPDLLKFYNMKKGTGGPKASFGDVQYLNDILKSGKKFDVEKAYAVGGVRLQSFSDFVPHMYFDYMQLFAELAAKKLPLHAYTKEVLFAKIFGLTGAKINMSLVPAVVEGGVAPGLDAEGNYAWADPVTDAEGNVIQQGQSFPYDEAMAIQQTEGYSKNCGVIAVGISDAHIEKMMEDPNIPFIIPYHKSSLNAIVARMTNIDQYKDYTNVQNTRKASGSKLDKGTKDFNFNEYLHSLGESGTPQQAAQAYLDWCRENKFIPKFSQFAYHPNYYKLLQDFNTIDLTTGEYAPQGAVTMTFPTEESAFGNVETLIQQGLQEDAALEEKMEQEIDGIADQVIARLEEIAKEPKMSDKQRVEKMAELADERMTKIKEQSGVIDLVEEAKKAVEKESGVSFRMTRTDEQRERLFGKAKERFGLTNNFNAAGYMLPDGSLLDFSEANDGGDPNQRSLDHREIEGIIMDEGKEYDSRWMYLADFMNEGAIRLLPEYAGINLMKAPTKEQRQKLFDFIYKYNGEVILEIADERLNNVAYVEYDRRTSPSRIFRDIDRYFNEGIVPQQSGISFRAVNDNQAIFVSNAAKAVEGIKMEKATPEQWLKMIEKNGGLKAGEDKWMGLSDWLKASDKKTLTKQEVLDFVNEHMIVIEEQHYSNQVAYDNNSRLMDEKYPGWRDAFSFEWDDYRDAPNADILDEEEAATLYNKYNEDKVEIDEDGEIVDDTDRNKVILWGEGLGKILFGLDGNAVRPIHDTREVYTTKGLINRHEIALTVPTIESWGKSDMIHFGDAGDGRAVAWIRFGETSYKTVSEDSAAYNESIDALYAYWDYLREKYGNGWADAMTEAEKAEEKRIQDKYKIKRANLRKKVLVIDEIQSKRHQEGREKGYKTLTMEERAKGYRKLIDAHDELYEKFERKYGRPFELASSEEDYKKIMSSEDFDALNVARQALSDARLEMRALKHAIPDAPFDKNWHELAMKRMLRYAAENGYDVIAWTKGEQQAERYGIGNAVSRIESGNAEGFSGTKKIVDIYAPNGVLSSTLYVNEDGKVVSGDYLGQSLSDIVGKEMAVKLMADGEVVIDGDNLRIGGEGMKGFYDRMLPAFMNKYGKKWGVKVEDIDLPNLENGLTMHSVPVTEEMKQSVMEGQVMFRIRTEEEDAMEFTQQVINDCTSRYNEVAEVHVFPENEETAERFGYTMEELKEIGGTYVKEEDIIAIFANKDRNDSLTIENIFFHESIHKLAEFYPEFKKIGEWMWDNSDVIGLQKIKNHIENGYDSEWYSEEMLTYGIAGAMSLGVADRLESALPEELQGDYRAILNEIGYEPGKESRRTESRISESSRRGAAAMERKTDESGRSKKEEARTGELTAEERRVIGEYFPEFNKGEDVRMRVNSQGKELTEGQEEFFANSKAVDKDGNLLVLYHGTPRAGFTEFKSGWFTTSKEDAISYSGDRKGRLFDPDEKYEPETLTAGDFRLGYMTFDSEEDRTAFLERFPYADEVMSEKEYEDARMGAEDEEYDALTARRKEFAEVWNAYREYERERFVDTTIGDLIANPETYTEEDLMRAMLEYDSNATFDNLDDMSAEERKDALVSALQTANEETEGGILDMVVPTRVPRNGEGLKHNDLGNRTYEVYANVEKPYEIDANGRGSELESGDVYKAIEEALNNPEYDGVIIRNWRVGRHQQLGDVVVPKNGSQIKLTSNENPSEGSDLRFRTSTNLDEEFGDAWRNQQNEDGRHSTQVANTKSTYEKIGRYLEDAGMKGASILDASSGLGLGTQALREMGFQVDDVEPFPSENREAPTFSSYADIDKQYDVVISNAVLNVIPDDWRADVLHQMADAVKEGGKMIINTRPASNIAQQGVEGKTRITLDSPSEILVKRGDRIAAYQKGFTSEELAEWIKSELGEGWRVEKATKKNSGISGEGTAVVIKERGGVSFRTYEQKEFDDTNIKDALSELYDDLEFADNGIYGADDVVSWINSILANYVGKYESDLQNIIDIYEDASVEFAADFRRYGGRMIDTEERDAEVASMLSNVIAAIDNEDNISFRVTGTPTDEVVADGLTLSPAQTAEVAANIFDALPEESRKKITDGLNGNILGLKDAILQIPASLATKENWDEEDIKLANAVRTAMQDAIDKQQATSRPLTTKEALWMLYDSTNTVKGLVDAASRAFVAHSLGFDQTSIQRKAEVDDYVRFRTASGGAIDAATDMYNYETSLWTERLKESWLDMNRSVISLQKAMAEASGMPIEPWENLEFALNRLSSKSYADKKKYLRDFLIPMWDTILDIVKHDHVSIEDIERYMMLKHGLERNKKFASRDAKEFYRAMYDLVAERMKNQSHAEQVVALSEAKKKLADIDAQIAVASSSQLPRLNEARARAQYDVDVADLVLRGDETQNEAELQAYYNAIDNEADPKYREFREKDYGGLTSMFVDTTDVKRSDYKSEEAYQQAVLASTTPRYDDVAAMESAAEREVSLFENKVYMYRALWDKVNAATKETLRHQYESGMITREQYEAVRDMFEFYVPLRGFADNTAEDMYSYYMTNSAGGFTKPILAAKGRKTRAESPLGWIGTMAESAIQADNKNEAKMCLYYATLRRPDQNLLAITETWYEYTGQKDANGKKIFKAVYPPAVSQALSADDLRQHMDTWEADMKQKQSRGEAYKGSQRVDLKDSVVFQDVKEEKEHIVRVKVAGQDYSILINGNPRAAQAINGLLNPDANVGPVAQWIGDARRSLSALLTSYSPLFWVANYQRDLLSSTMRVSEANGWNAAMKYLANRRKAWRVASYIYKYDAGTLGDSYYEKLYKEFADNGGVTGYTALTTNKEYENLLEKYANNVDKHLLNAVKGIWDKFIGFGEAIEQVSRFAAFITAREEGKSIEEAINAAKEVSVNFNRKGSAKPVSLDELDKLRTKDGKKLNKAQRGAALILSAMPGPMKFCYYFVNASIQALSSSVKLAKKSPGKATTWVGMYMGTSIALAMLNYLLSDDDDDEYLNLPDYLRHSTALVKVADGYYFKWSIPQEMRPFYAWADILVRKMMGKMPHKSGKDVGKEMALAASQWLPVNPFEAEDPLLSLIPDFASPLAEIKANTNAFGGKIYDDMAFKSEGVVKEIPAYRKATEKTGDIYVDISEFLNDVSGGDEVTKGMININPAIMEHLIEGYGGGIYDFAKMMVSIPSMILSDDPVQIKEIPFVNKVILSVDETNMYSHTNEAFFHYKDIADNAKRVEKEYRESDDPSRADDYQKEEDWRVYLLYKQYEADFKNVKERLDNAVDKEEEDLLKQEQNVLREMFLNDIAKGDLPEVTFQIREDIKRIDKEIKEAMKPVSDANKERLEKKNAGDVDGMLKAIEKRDSLKETPEYRKAEEMKADLKEIKRQLEELGTVTRSSQRDSVIGEIQKNYDALIRKRAEL